MEPAIPSATTGSPSSRNEAVAFLTSRIDYERTLSVPYGQRDFRLDRMRQLLDYSALPQFERVAKYFYYSLISGSSTPDGISFKLAVPTPPGLK